MALMLVRTDDEVNKLLNDCARVMDEGTTRFPGQSCEESIYTTILWLTGQSEDYPYEDE